MIWVVQLRRRIRSRLLQLTLFQPLMNRPGLGWLYISLREATQFTMKNRCLEYDLGLWREICPGIAHLPKTLADAVEQTCSLAAVCLCRGSHDPLPASLWLRVLERFYNMWRTYPGLFPRYLTAVIGFFSAIAGILECRRL